MKTLTAIIASAIGIGAASAQLVQINSTPILGGDVNSFALSAGGSRVVYRGDLGTDEVFNVYSSTPTLSSQVQVNTAPVSGGDVASAAPVITFDGSRTIFTGDILTDANFQVYSRSTTASDSQLLLSGTALEDRNVQGITQAALSGNYVYYRAEGPSDNRMDIYRVEINTANSVTKLSNATNDSREVANLAGFGASGTKIVYTGDILTTDNRLNVYTANADGSGSQVQISTDNLSNFLLAGQVVTPDGARVVYRGAFANSGRLELFSASTSATDNSTQVLLQGHGSDRSIDAHYVTPDSARVVYVGDMTDNDVSEVYSTPVASSSPIKLSTTPVTGGDVSQNSLQFVPDGSRVVYVGDLTTDGFSELYSASTTATGTQVKINTSVVNGTVSTAFDLTSDGSQVIFFGDLTTDATNDLYVASTTAAGTQVALTNLGSGLGITGVPVISPDDEFVAFTLINSSGFRSLWYTAIDNSISPVQLTPNVAWTTAVNGLTWMPDSSGVLFIGDYGSDNEDNLYFGAIPEPSVSILLVGSGLALFFSSRRRRF